MKKLRVKLEKKGEKTLEEKERENEELRQKLQQYESGKEKIEPEPEEDKYETTGEFIKAHTAWALKKSQMENQAAIASSQLKEQQEEIQAKTEAAVDEHYERAAKLAKQHDISADAYRSAETNFRKAIDSVIPGVADAIADGLIARLGEGSERVIYNLGVNAKNREIFIDKLKSDPSGLDAYGYLVEKKTQLASTAKRRSNAPAPAKKVNGDVDTRLVHDNLKKKYKDAQRSGNLQKVFDARKVARQAGIPAREINEW
jgi:hypothetical protein